MAKRNWIGKPFVDWCKADPEDGRKINYLLKGIWDGKQWEARFTSEDMMDSMFLFRLQNSLIESLQLINDEWHVVLVY